jgi:hypothetical protein
MSFLLNKNKDENKIITLSTCWYILKSKFNVKTYLSWITNLLSIVDNFNLVIYTDVSSLKHFVHLIDFSNKKIKIIITPIEEFYTYKYKDSWIKNHEKSNLKLHSYIDWRLNMLWNEKIFFVNETIKKKYFNTLYYGWCDIGYFRNRPNDLHCDYLKNWPNNQKLLDGFFNEKIHYACVQNDKSIYLNLQNDIITHYSNKLESQPTIQPTTQIEEICFAGGFFILKKDLIDNYIKLYDEKLVYYFTNNFIIKDDQSIVMDIIFTNPNLFSIHTEDTNFDNWFMFQRLLL